MYEIEVYSYKVLSRLNPTQEFTGRAEIRLRLKSLRKDNSRI